MKCKFCLPFVMYFLRKSQFDFDEITFYLHSTYNKLNEFTQFATFYVHFDTAIVKIIKNITRLSNVFVFKIKYIHLFFFYFTFLQVRKTVVIIWSIMTTTATQILCRFKTPGKQIFSDCFRKLFKRRFTNISMT